MSTTSVNLLKERVLRAAFAAVDELSDEVMLTKATRELKRAVKALRDETWRLDEAPILIKELLQLVESSSNPHSSLNEQVKKGTVVRAKAFLGMRTVEDETTPVPRPRKGILRRKDR